MTLSWLVAALLAAPALAGRTLTVAFDGSGDFTTMQDALEAAKPGDVVSVKVQYGRLGLALDIKAGLPTVKEVLPQSPALAAGITAGDRIVEVDGRSTRGMELPAVVEAVRGQAGTAVRLMVRREGWPGPRPFEIMRGALTYAIKDDLDRGNAASDQQEFALAATYYGRRAQAGDPKGLKALADLYYTGKGVKKDAQEALRRYREAAEAGDVGAMSRLGAIHEGGLVGKKNPAEAMAWYRKAAAAGDLASQAHLGHQLIFGDAAIHDEAEGIKWLRLAADAGEDHAQTILGAAYEYGKGVGVDKAKAALWYGKAAAQGNAKAQENLDKLPAAPAPVQTQADAAPPAPAAPAAPAAVTRDEMRAMLKEMITAPGKPKESGSSDVDSPSYRVEPDPDKFALIIGIEKYSELPEARFAERDAQAVRSHLAALGFPERNIVSVIGPKATKSAFSKNIETWLPKNVSANSTVFVYFSGHGAPEPGTGQAYLVPWDGDPQFLEESAYPLKRLHERLGKLKAKRVILAMDACFSGAGGRSVLAKGTRPLVTRVEISPAASGKIVSLSAAASDQVSGTLEEAGHGLFTYYLLKGLNGAAAAPGGGVTLGSLYDYISPRVQDEARRQNREQSPQLLPRGGEPTGLRLR